MAKQLLIAHCRPSLLMKRMVEHKCDVSEGTKYKSIAKRQLLGRQITFYSNGLRVIEGLDLTEQEQHDSEILRLTHASILIGEPVGDKRMCWVDATKDPVEIWVYGMELKDFIKRSKVLVENNLLSVDFLLEEPLKRTSELKNERNVKLFGGTVNSSHFSDR
jgi:hypothetical protein